jgi:drug/metabolite transporter (DMT)-like permease
METPAWTIGLTFLTALMAAVGQLLFKQGASAVSVDLVTWLLNVPLLVGLALHALGFVLLVIALKHGQLSVLYPVLATSYIWVALMSVWFLAEPFSPTKWAGVGLIMAGIALIVR